MNQKMIYGFIGGMIVMVLALGWGDEDKGVVSKKSVAQALVVSKAPAVQAQTPIVTKPASKTEAADYSRYLMVKEAESITGQSGLKLKSIDSKKSGEAYDLTYSTAEGQAILMIQVLRGRDYEMYYKDYRCQDYKPMEYAFWGPKTAASPNQVDQLWFRKGDTLIFIGSKRTHVDLPMMEKVAKVIASRL